MYVSIDYRTAEELGDLDGKSQQEIVEYYRGIAPQEWVENTFTGAESEEQIQQAVAMYTAQRDSKAALRWIVANADTYDIDTSEIAVGGASAGSITTVALGITDLGDFRDEISITDDPTLSTTNLNETYEVQSLVYFWGSNIKSSCTIQCTMSTGTTGTTLNCSWPMGMETTRSLPTREPGSQDIYNSLNIHNELVTLEGHGHGAWNAVVDGKGLFDLSFEFLVERQNLTL